MARKTGAKDPGTTSVSKEERLLSVYTQLITGETLDLARTADKYQCDPKTIKRDKDRILNFLREELGIYTMDGDSPVEDDDVDIENLASGQDTAVYRLRKADRMLLSKGEVIAICKILLDSKGLAEEEMEEVIRKLMNQSILKDDRSFIREILQNEWFNYTEASHSLPLLERILEISEAIKERNVLKLSYKRSDGKNTEWNIEPLGLIFNEYYFYLAAHIVEKKDKVTDSNPTIFRLDRIVDWKNTGEVFEIPENRRFKDGEYRKRIQFMMGGDLNRIKLLVREFSYEIVLDHLPDFEIRKNTEYREGKDAEYEYIFEGELFGDGIKFFLMTQGDGVKLVEPQKLKDVMKERAKKLMSIYGEE